MKEGSLIMIFVIRREDIDPTLKDVCGGKLTIIFLELNLTRNT